MITYQPKMYFEDDDDDDDDDAAGGGEFSEAKKERRKKRNERRQKVPAIVDSAVSMIKHYGGHELLPILSLIERLRQRRAEGYPNYDDDKQSQNKIDC